MYPQEATTQQLEKWLRWSVYGMKSKKKMWNSRPPNQLLSTINVVWAGWLLLENKFKNYLLQLTTMWHWCYYSSLITLCIRFLKGKPRMFMEYPLCESLCWFCQGWEEGISSIARREVKDSNKYGYLLNKGSDCEPLPTSRSQQDLVCRSDVAESLLRGTPSTVHIARRYM